MKLFELPKLRIKIILRQFRNDPKWLPKNAEGYPLKTSNFEINNNYKIKLLFLVPKFLEINLTDITTKPL